MAHKLARSGGPESDNQPTNEPAEGENKWDINRRSCLKFGGAALASLLLGGASSSAAAGSGEPDVHWTNFSEGQL